MPDSKKIIRYNGELIEVSEEIHKVLQKTYRKDKYMVVDLKTERIKIDQENETVLIKPSREDSLDRLMDQNLNQFSSENLSVEDEVLKKILVEKLRQNLEMLSCEEKELINLHFYQQIPETEIAKKYHVNQSTISRRLKKIYNKLKVFLNL